MRFLALASVAFFLLTACATAPPSSSRLDAAKPFDYMESLRKSESDVAAAGNDAAKRKFSLQMLANDQSWVGDTEHALDSFREAGYRNRTWSPADAVIDPQVRGAVDAIVEAVRDRQIVMINEAHHMPRDRAFAMLVALELRKLGFQYLAMETLAPQTDELAKRGYPLTDDGYYSRDPLFGDYIRQALRAGFTPVAYEFSKFEENDPEKRVDIREEGQASNIVERVLSRDPKARILFHVGYGHLRKANDPAHPLQTQMAEHLRRKTGIDPYCIDQTQRLPGDAALAKTLIDAAPVDAFVVTPRGAAVRYLASPAVDMFVFHKPVRLVNGRPQWLSMNGYRAARAIPSKQLPKHGRRLVQAFVAGESVDAVPMDQVLVEAGKPTPKFMLPKGRYRFTFQD